MSLILIKDITPMVISFQNLGIDIVDSEDKRTFKYPLRLAFGIVGTVVWYYAMAQTCITYYNDVDKFVATMAILLQLTLATVKILYFFGRKQQLVELNAKLESLAKQANSAEAEIWNTEVATVLPITQMYGLTALATISVSSVVPLLRLIYMYVLYDEVVYTLPLPGIFPYDIRTPLNFLLTYIFLILLVMFGLSGLLSTDGIFSWFVFSLAAHMKILRLKFAQMLHNGLDADFYYEFVQIVFYHRRIIDLAAEFDALFAFIVFLEVTTSCMQLCFLAYEMVFSADATNFIFSCLLMGTIMIQLLIFCFGGEKVKNESEIFCDQLYMLTPWQSLPPKVRQLFLFPLMRSQRALSLTGYFFSADRSLMVWIFRTAGSFTALLFAMKSK